MDVIRIGVCGSPLYENKTSIKEIVHKLKNTFGEALVVVSGGRLDGADKYVKKYALEFGCKYEEFNPAHTKKNLYSVLKESFYDKKYATRNFFIRNKIMIDRVDYVIVFVEEGKGNADIAQLVTETRRKDKKLVMMD